MESSSRTNRFFLLLILILFPLYMMGQDVVTLKDGSNLICKVIEVGDNQIIAQQSGGNESITILIKDIDYITFANGEKEIFGKKGKSKPVSQNNNNQLHSNENISISSSYNYKKLDESNINDYSKWSIWFRLGPAFFKSSHSEGHRDYSGKMGFETTIGTKYYLTKKNDLDAIRASIDVGIGYFESNSYMSVSGYKTETQSKCLNLPIELTLVLPLTSSFGFDVGGGPSFMYIFGGKINMDGEKYSLSEFEDQFNTDIKRISSCLRIKGGLYWGCFTLNAYLGIPLTKASEYENKKENFWGITLGSELFF